MMRYVRYAAAVVFALLAVGFVALWVRSYWALDALQIRVSDRQVMAVGVIKGSCFLSRFDANTKPKTWNLFSVPARGDAADGFERSAQNLIAVRVEEWGASNRTVIWPTWLVAFLCGSVATVLFIRRFNVRALLVATTLLAAILGLAVYAV